MEKQHLRVWLKMAALLAVYVGAGRFGLSLAIVNSSASAVWPPTGIALAALIILGLRAWPCIFLGAFLVNIMTSSPSGTPVWLAFGKSLGVAIGNTMEACGGAWLVQKFAGGAEVFERAANVFKFTILAALGSTMISATVGVVSLTATSHAGWKEFSTIWLTWWLGDMAGALMIPPLVLVWVRQPIIHFSKRQWLEAAALVVIVIVVGYGIFLGGISPDKTKHLKYLAEIPLLWAAFRFKQHGAVTGAFMMSAMALAGTLHGSGPFAMVDANESLLFLQGFLGTIYSRVPSPSRSASKRRRNRGKHSGKVHPANGRA